ncbi:MAG: zinc ribbon domain-containing protein [bacterium]|nr:zinc ribbon domain-containing protein [bacterium]
MPIYEYICSQCGHAFEKLVPSSKSKPQCDNCGSPKLDRQFSTFSAHGGGSGSSACRSADQCPAAMASGGSACGSGCPHAN